jgi:hypothetical protein
MQTNWMRYVVWINSGSGVRWMRGATVSFAEKLLLAGKSKWRAAHAKTDRYG